MNCPACGSTGAYVGLSAVECASPACKHFKAPASEPLDDPFAADESAYTNKLYADGGPLAGYRKTKKEATRLAEMLTLGPPPMPKFVDLAVPGEYRYIPLFMYMPRTPPSPLPLIANFTFDDDDECRCDTDCNCYDEEDDLE